MGLHCSIYSTQHNPHKVTGVVFIIKIFFIFLLTLRSTRNWKNITLQSPRSEVEHQVIRSVSEPGYIIMISQAQVKPTIDNFTVVFSVSSVSL